MNETSNSTRGNWIITNNLLPMKEFEDVIFPHGLLAYTGCRYETMKRVEALEDKNLHICCGLPGQHIGEIGIYVKGDVKVISESDLHSNVLLNNNRVFDPKYLIEVLDKDGLEKADVSVTGEAIISNVEIVGIWHKKDCDNKALEKLHTYLPNLDVVEVADYKPFLLTSY